MHFGQAYLNGYEIFERFTHLMAIDVQMTNVDETIHPFFAAMICLKTRQCQRQQYKRKWARTSD